MVQPPADTSIGAAALCHYTWGSIFHDRLQNDTEVWKFDKRFFTARGLALKVCCGKPVQTFHHTNCNLVLEVCVCVRIHSEGADGGKFALMLHMGTLAIMPCVLL